MKNFNTQFKAAIIFSVMLLLPLQQASAAPDPAVSTCVIKVAKLAKPLYNVLFKALEKSCLGKKTPAQLAPKVTKKLNRIIDKFIALEAKHQCSMNEDPDAVLGVAWDGLEPLTQPEIEDAIDMTTLCDGIETPM